VSKKDPEDKEDGETWWDPLQHVAWAWTRVALCVRGTGASDPPEDYRVFNSIHSRKTR
jgi:hypothetical protein